MAVLFIFSLLAHAQGTPPPDPEQLQKQPPAVIHGSPPGQQEPGRLQKARKMAEKELERAVIGPAYPSRGEWHPITAKQKFQYFVHSTYSPRTFAGAAVDAIRYKIGGDNPHYEHGFLGIAQHYGVELATGESDVFFERFLVPTLLRQDPRYFRAPNLPFFKRVAYSVSRVMITHADDGSETFNASRIVGGAVSQALSDVYVPGHSQGVRPVANRVAFDLARDAGFNLLHEFWPDLRRVFFHR